MGGDRDTGMGMGTGTGTGTGTGQATHQTDKTDSEEKVGISRRWHYCAPVEKQSQRMWVSQLKSGKPPKAD
jgi:hypothetical protein